MEFMTSPGLVPYPDALAEMEDHVARMAEGTAAGRIWFLEHPPLYTAGTSANPADLRDPKFPVYETGRGGQYTYHGPGQRVAYVMLDLKQYYPVPDIRAFVHDLEEVIIRALASLGVAGARRAGRIGIWVIRPQDGAEAKIAALGIRVRKGVSYHGISVNVNPDLSHFSGIVPCGISDYGVTSLADLGVPATMADLDTALKQAFLDVFKK